MNVERWWMEAKEMQKVLVRKGEGDKRGEIIETMIIFVETLKSRDQ